MLLTLPRLITCEAQWDWSSSANSLTDVLPRNYGYSSQPLRLNTDLGVLVSVLLAGVIPDNFPIEIWHGVVWITLASSASYILRDEAEWNIAYTLLTDVRTTSVVVTNCLFMRGKLECQNRKIMKVVLSDPKQTNWPSRKCTLDATGLGGSDLPSQVKADITVRTDKHKQNIYGLSQR